MIRQWFKQFDTPDEWLAFIRLMTTPALWFLARRGKSKAVAAGVIFAAVTDVLDGAYCRFSGERSDFSKQFDTVADLSIILSAPVFVALLYPETARQRAKPLALLGAAAVPVLALEWRKFHRLGALHIDSARGTAVVAHLWLLNLLWRGKDSDRLFDAFLLAAGAAAAESVYIIVTRGELESLSETPLLDDICAALGVRNPLELLPVGDATRRRQPGNQLAEG